MAYEKPIYSRLIDKNNSQGPKASDQQYNKTMLNKTVLFKDLLYPLFLSLLLQGILVTHLTSTYAINPKYMDIFVATNVQLTFLNVFKWGKILFTDISVILGLFIPLYRFKFPSGITFLLPESFLHILFEVLF